MSKQKDGEIWVYTNDGVKQITIKHPKYGVLKYYFNIPIEGGRTYELLLEHQQGGNFSAATQTFTVDGVSYTMVRVEGGTFTRVATSEQGSDISDIEKSAHKVTLSSFYIGQTEVTQALWQAVMGYNPSNFKGNKLPVEMVSWDDCQEFIKKLNAQTGKNFRLPTEAEWEYAAWGGKQSRGYKYSGSNTAEQVAWYYENSGDCRLKDSDNELDNLDKYHCRTHEVATKSPNELGLYDMSGNVWEWCQDWFGNYSSGSQTNPTGASKGPGRVLRGGGWESEAWFCRVSCRSFIGPGTRIHILGLRLAL